MVEIQNVKSLGIPKDDFLAHVRRSLGRSDRVEPAPPYRRLAEDLAVLEEREEEIRHRLVEKRSDLLDQFAETARLRNWNLFRTASTEDAVGYIVELAKSHLVSQAARSNQPVFDELPLDSALRSEGIECVTVLQDETNSRERLRSQIIESSLGITGADYAVAETGSVVILPRKGLSRLVSLVPPVHLAIVRVEDLVESLDDVFLLRRLEYYRNNEEMGSYLNFITGPSRTADIEMKLVVGVHGPREVHLILLG